MRKKNERSTLTGLRTVVDFCTFCWNLHEGLFREGFKIFFELAVIFYLASFNIDMFFLNFNLLIQ